MNYSPRLEVQVLRSKLLDDRQLLIPLNHLGDIHHPYMPAGPCVKSDSFMVHSLLIFLLAQLNIIIITIINNY